MTAVEKFRRSLDMTQAAFSVASGFSVKTISDWETGRRVSDAAEHRLKTYAVEQGRADLAALFDPAPFKVRKLIVPPKAKGAAVDVHSLLDEILESGDDQAKLAIENFLFITTQYLRGVK